MMLKSTPQVEVVAMCYDLMSDNGQEGISHDCAS